MSEFLGQESLEQNMQVVLKDEGKLSLTDLNLFLYLFETLSRAAYLCEFRLNKKEFIFGISDNQASIKPDDDATTFYRPSFNGKDLKPFECKDKDHDTFDSLFKELETVLSDSISENDIRSLSKNPEDMWAEIALSIRKKLPPESTFYSELLIKEFTYCSPPKITFGNASFFLIVTICLTGGKIDLLKGQAEVNGITDSIVKLKNALVSEKTLECALHKAVAKRTEEKDAQTLLNMELQARRELLQRGKDETE